MLFTVASLLNAKNVLALIVRWPTTTNGAALTAGGVSLQERDSGLLSGRRAAVANTSPFSRQFDIMPHNSPRHNSRLGNHIIAVCCVKRWPITRVYTARTPTNVYRSRSELKKNTERSSVVTIYKFIYLFIYSIYQTTA